MTITELLAYIAEKKVCSLSMIAIHFNTQESAVEPILDRLIEKGKIVRKIQSPNYGCGGCGCGSNCGCGTQEDSCDNSVVFQLVRN